MKKILITGGAGFIGFELSRKFINDGYEVTILDNLSSKIHSNKSKYEALKNISNFIVGDVCSRKDLELAITNQDAIIHLASETGTGQSMYDIHNYTNVNIGSTALMLDILSNSKNNNPLQSPSLSNTITAWRDLITRLGLHLLFPTPLSCLAAAMAVQQCSMQRLFQVK